jgi:apolipoprotein N-acyltransferase
MLDWLDLSRRGTVTASIRPGEARTMYVRAGAWPVAWFVSAWLALALLGPWPRRPRESEAAA